MFLITSIQACAIHNQSPNCKVSNNTHQCITHLNNNKTSSISKTMQFNYALDEFITKHDPRIQSLITVTQQSPDSTLEITPTNPNAIHLAMRLYNIFRAANIIVNHLVRVLPTQPSVTPNNVLVVIKPNNTPNPQTKSTNKVNS